MICQYYVIIASSPRKKDAGGTVTSSPCTACRRGMAWHGR